MLQGKEVIILAGCSGRLGSALAPLFSDPRYAIIGLDAKLPKANGTNFEYIHCNLSNGTEVRRAMKKVGAKYGDKIASFVHLTSRPNAEKWLMEAAHSFQTEQFLFASTHQVHAPCAPGQKIREDSKLLPQGDYSRAKLQTEEQLLKTHKSVPLVILRLAQGYDELCHQLQMSRQIRRIYEKRRKSVLYQGNPTAASAYAHYEDLAEALWLAVQRRFGLTSPRTLLVGEPETVSFGELQKVIGLLCHGQECKTIWIPKWLASLAAFLSSSDDTIQHASHNYSMDIGEAMTQLGWSPKRSLRQTLPRIIASLKENPLSWYRENGFEAPQNYRRRV